MEHTYGLGTRPTKLRNVGSDHPQKYVVLIPFISSLLHACTSERIIQSLHVHPDPNLSQQWVDYITTT